MVIILAPGPSVLFVIARAIAWGRKTAVFSVAGNVTGAFSLSVFVALGLGPILQRSELAYIAVQWGGGLYLIYLGIDAIRKRTVHAADMTNQGDVAPSARRSMWDGYWVGALNPKGVVFFAGTARNWLATDGKRLEKLRATGGVIMIILGLGVLYSAIVSA